jgi:hypothetical protein
VTHADLVKAAAKWLAKDHPVVITEMAIAGEEPDAWGWDGGLTTLVECKASRADYFADKRKPKVRMGDWRYYLTPGGLIEVEELRPGWGLLYADGRGVHVASVAPEHDRKNWRGESLLLGSAVRRIGQSAPPGVSVRCYTYETKCRATLGVQGV